VAALTEAQKADIRLYVGWSARFHQEDSRLEHALLSLDANAAAQALVLDLVTACKAIDTGLTAAHSRLKASEVGSIKLNPAEITARRSEGRRLVGRICAILDVEPHHDVFGSGAFATTAGFGRANEAGSGGYVGK
jgi:hypothetical protein